MNAPIEPWVRDILRCPVGRHRLLDDVDESGEPVLVCEPDCPAPGSRRHYPVREGIPVLLVQDSVVQDR